MYSISFITTIKFDFNILIFLLVTQVSSNVYEPCLYFDTSCLRFNICYTSVYNDSVAAFLLISFYLNVSSINFSTILHIVTSFHSCRHNKQHNKLTSTCVTSNHIGCYSSIIFMKHIITSLFSHSRFHK